MENSFLQWFQKWKEKIDPKYRIYIVFGGIAAVLLVVFFVFNSNKAATAGSVVLYSGLDSADIQSVSKELVREGINYTLDSTGKNISVQASSTDAAKIRMRMGALNIPRYGNPGFELFDTSQIGATQYDKNVQYERALKGQLESDLVNGSGGLIENATVTLSVDTDPTIFSDSPPQSKASVSLSVSGGRKLSDSQIQGIQNEVSSAVKNLKAQDVKVIVGGVTVSDNTGTDSVSGAVSKEMEIKKETEDQVKKGITDSLSAIYGSDHVRVNVSANINFDAIVQNIEKYDPNGTLRSQETDKETSTKTDGTPAEAGSASNGNVPNYQSTTGTNTNMSQDTEKTIQNWEIGKTVETITKHPELTYLSVAVWLDSGPNGISPEEIDKIKKTVAVAAGITDKNNDGVFENGEVDINTQNFNQNVINNPAVDKGTKKTIWDLLLGDEKNRVIFVGVIGALFLFVIVSLLLFAGGRKKIQVPIQESSKLKNEEKEIGEDEGAEGEERIIREIRKIKTKRIIDEDEDEETIIRRKSMSQKAAEHIERDPQKAGEKLKRWIDEE